MKKAAWAQFILCVKSSDTHSFMWTLTESEAENLD